MLLLTLSVHVREGYSCYFFCVSVCHKLILKMASFYLSKRASKHSRRLFKDFKGAVAHGDYFFPKKFEFVSLYSFICLQAVYQLSGPVCKATWSDFPSYSASHLHFTLCD